LCESVVETQVAQEWTQGLAMLYAIAFS
jgi:hypothetical protein